MLYYKLFFIIFTLAELIFTLVYYLITKKTDHTMMLGAMIYGAGMLMGYIASRIYLYNKKRKELLDSLP